MSYTKVIKYGKTLEIYSYEDSPRPTSRKSRLLATARRNQSLALSREAKVGQEEQRAERRRSSARRASMAFRRLVSANLGQPPHPILASLTYAENMAEIGQGRKDFSAFIRHLQKRWGNSISYIAVPEFQKRGALHFHTLLWGLPPGLVETERTTRLVASLWKQGFIDLKQTDGNAKISSYLAKYMVKGFKDKRLFGKKAYIASRNIIKPLIFKNTMAWGHLVEHDLSTAEPVIEKEYMTQWLGMGRYSLYEIIS